MLAEFDLLMPETLPEALEALTAGAPDVVPIAGGTNLLVDLRDGRRHPKVLMDLGRLEELRTIQIDGGYVIVGGGTTITQLANDPLVARHGAPLRAAAEALGNPLIRNRATVAGNLVDASPAADTAPPLLVLDAEAQLASQEGTRWIPLEDLTLGPNQTVLRPQELLVAIRWPIPSPRSVGAFYKIGLRKATTCSVVTVAVRATVGSDGSCQNARIALGAVAPTPIRAHAAEKALRAQPFGATKISEAARLSAMATSPIDDVRSSAAYRRRMTEVLVRRLLTQIADNGNS